MGKLIAGISTYSFIYLFDYYTHYLNWNENSSGNDLLVEMLGRALEYELTKQIQEYTHKI